MDGRLTWTDCDEAGDYVVPNVLSPRDLVFRPDNMDETVPHKSNTNWDVHPLKMARDLKSQILEVEGLYYLCRENKGTVPLFSHMQKTRFLMIQLLLMKP